MVVVVVVGGSGGSVVVVVVVVVEIQGLYTVTPPPCLSQSGCGSGHSQLSSHSSVSCSQPSSKTYL